MARSLIKAYDRVKNIDWEPTYIAPEEKYVEPTRFHLPKKATDPFKTFIREYFAMEREKESRHYALLEAAGRFQSATPEPRWMEGMKFALANLSAIEYSAGRQMGRMARVVAPLELRQGYMMQVLDEMRHTQLEMNTLRHHMRSWEDPAGYDMAMIAAGNSVGAGIFRSFCEDFMTCDAVETSLGLQLFVETAYSNMFFIGLSSAATLSGDPIMASTMLTIQSDESRHMANGYATLMTVLQDDRNIPLVQEVLDKWAWRSHVGFGVGMMLFADYFVKNKTESAKEMAQRWLLDDFYGGLYKKLEKYGIREPRWLPDILRNIEWASHSAAVYLFGAWPAFFHRYDPLDEREMDWFEQKYPGWHGYYGKFWEAYKHMTDPDAALLVTKELGGLPAFCQVCQLPWIFPRPDASEGRSVEKDGRMLAFCSPACQWIYEKDPVHYSGFKSFYDLYDGWDLADVVLDLGYLREDGKTLIAQPVLKPKRLWTIDDIRRCQYEVVSPQRRAVVS
jgi:methane monooxygenase component A alpha chain/propane monooxygenase large subunit